MKGSAYSSAPRNASRNCGGIFDIAGKHERLTALEARTAEPNFWDDREEAQGVVQETKLLKTWVDPFEALDARVRSAVELDEMLRESPDAEMLADLDSELEAIDESMSSFELRSLLRGDDDFRDAQVEIAAGAGGTEAQDWAEMLLRMYTRWAERRGFKVEILDRSEGEEAGIKGAVLESSGDHAYGFLKPEAGVHRLVRISPFDANARRHTSFASIFVYPVVNEEINIEIKEDDLRIDVYRASGAGGQHVNKTSSAVRITHIPTGLVTASQQERSQYKNKATAMKMLKNKLYQAEVTRREAEKAKVDAAKTSVSFGNQTRSYVFQPYTMVNVHRTDLNFPDVHYVMDGGIDPFIEAYLKMQAEQAAS